MPARAEKVADLVQREIARLLQFEVHDARLGFVTVTEVRMSGDLRHARVFVSSLAGAEAHERILGALEDARGFVRRRLAQTLQLKRTPEIRFEIDTSLEYGSRIEELIRSTHKDEEAD